MNELLEYYFGITFCQDKTSKNKVVGKVWAVNRAAAQVMWEPSCRATRDDSLFTTSDKGGSFSYIFYKVETLGKGHGRLHEGKGDKKVKKEE